MVRSRRAISGRRIIRVYGFREVHFIRSKVKVRVRVRLIVVFEELRKISRIIYC
jgi:hypothetical protein